MSLDVYLNRKRWVSYDDGVTHTEDWEELLSLNITHNLGKMAERAGIYKELWTPESIGITKASQLITPLEKGLEDLLLRPEYFKKFGSPNGWGVYSNFVPFVSAYLSACKKYPEANVEVWR